MNRLLLSVLGLSVFSLFVVGCGGGGGGSKPSSGKGFLSVTLDSVAGAADGPTGTAHTIVIYRSDGKEVDKKSVNLSAGTRRIDFSNLPSGTLHLHVGVGASAGAVETGAIDTTFEGDGVAAPVIVRMKQDVASVTVAPASATVNVGATRAVYAAARASDGAYVYTTPAGWAWTSDATGVATVDGSGIVTGVAQGTAGIQATHVASAKFASAAMSVVSDAVRTGKWTVLVYMDAANDLYPYAADNVNQMESIANDPDVRFLIQWKQVQGVGGNTSPTFSGTRRYLAAYDSTSLLSANNPVKSTLVKDLGAGVDMASPASLRDFIAWAKAKYPAEHYALVLWSHGSGWFSRALGGIVPPRAIIYDDEKNTSLSLPDVRSALDDGGLDVLAYDACLMQGAESLVEFSAKTKAIVGSEDNTPGPGLPYQLVFKPFVDSPDASLSSLTGGMATAFVNYYKNVSGVDWPLHMSALDTGQAATVASAVDGLGQALLSDASAAGAAMRSIRANTTRIQPSDGYWYYDLDQLATNLAAQSTLSAGVHAAAASVKSAVASAATADAGSARAAHLKGMSIEFAASSSFANYASGYGKLRLSGLTHWDEFLANATANP